MHGICNICKKECKCISKHVFREHKITSKKYYNLFFKSIGDGKCKICNKITRFKSLDKGYCKYCSDICSSKDNFKNLKISNTISSKEYQDKLIKSNLKKYGVKYTSQLNSVKNKTKKTCLKKYGKEHHLKCKTIRDKIKKTCINRYNCENVGQNDVVKDKIKNTCLKKYGYKSHLYDEKIQKRIKKYNLKNYGVEYKFQSDVFRKKSMYDGKYKLKIYIINSVPIYYQTKPELNFIKFCEINNIKIKNGDKIPYIFNNKKRIYFCDFKIKENKTWRLVEIKKKHKWWYDELKSGKMKQKVKAAIKFSKFHGYLPYKIKFNF